jgi:hypothetical protein
MSRLLPGCSSEAEIILRQVYLKIASLGKTRPNRKKGDNSTINGRKRTTLTNATVKVASQ